MQQSEVNEGGIADINSGSLRERAASEAGRCRGDPFIAGAR